MPPKFKNLIEGGPNAFGSCVSASDTKSRRYIGLVGEVVLVPSVRLRLRFTVPTLLIRALKLWFQPTRRAQTAARQIESLNSP